MEDLFKGIPRKLEKHDCGLWEPCGLLFSDFDVQSGTASVSGGGEAQFLYGKPYNCEPSIEVRVAKLLRRP